MERNPYLARVDAIAATWDLWSSTGQDLSPGQWRAQSRCEGWDVACLFAHVSMFPLALSGPPPAAGDASAGPVLSAVEILANFNRPGGAAHALAGPVADQAREVAAGLSGDELVERFRDPAAAAVTNLRGADPELVIPWPATGGGTRLEEGLRIVLLESVVHLLDVLRALGREPALPSDALLDTASLLARLASPVEFIEAATGRGAINPFPLVR